MRTCIFLVGLPLVIATLGYGQGLGEPGPEVGQDEAVAAIRGLGGRVSYDKESHGRPIVSVDLTQTDVADADLLLLKALTCLQRLYLNSTRVTDAGLQHLKGLTSLQVYISVGMPAISVRPSAGMQRTSPTPAWST